MASARNSSFTTAAPPLTFPLSQNTAPVLKFQCLFTHDVRRKAKRWQDGFLRFHTFNKRVMVYDDAGNFIGDLHRQTEGDPHDGDELELDGGTVLVQVGECVSRTETDLAPLFEQRRNKVTGTTRATTANTSFQSPATSFQSTGFSTPTSQAQYPADRLKPLNEVLGIKRGAVGRAVLPVQSPYEERHQHHDNNDMTDISRRPAKRKSSSIHEARSSGTSRNLPVPPRQPLGGARTNGTALGSRQTPISLDVDETESGGATGLDFRPASMVKITKQTKSSANRRGSKDTQSSNRQRSIMEVFPSQNLPDMPRFPAPKPRNKLMCLDLLSPSTSEKQPRSRKDTVADHDRQSPDAPRPVSKPRRDPVTDILSRPFALTPTDGNSSLAFIPTESTLRALEEAAAPPSSQRDRAISEFFKPQERPAPRPPPPPQPRQLAPDQTTSRETNAPPRRDTSACQPRSLARSNSDIPLTSALTSNENPLLGGRQPRSPAKPLQRSLSDVSHLQPNNRFHSLQTRLPLATTAMTDLAQLSTEPDHEERGPWTSEALDLFDWWPPGRPKPTAATAA